MTKSTGIFVVKKTNKKHTETIEKKIWINGAPIKRKWHRTQVWGSNNKQEGLGEAQQRAKPYNFPPRGLKKKGGMTTASSPTILNKVKLASTPPQA